MVEDAQEHRDDPLALGRVELSSLLLNLGIPDEADLLLISHLSHCKNLSLRSFNLSYI